MAIGSDQQSFEMVYGLEQYAMLDGSEWGEACMAMIGLWYNRAHISERLLEALETEIDDQHQWAKENLRIVETTETTTRNIRTVVFVDDLDEGEQHATND